MKKQEVRSTKWSRTSLMINYSRIYAVKRSNRKFTDEAAVAFKVKDAGYDPYEKKLLGITAMSTLLGKKKFEELLGELVYKPPGKPALVPESDKRPAMNTAIDDFSV